ncbi:hypothetical protein BDR06DRAFT_976398 [Suillus hirtellus]|nr:hypothetical protein BDR06DRAFT_976398 [Suillus hirtellus]
MSCLVLFVLKFGHTSDYKLDVRCICIPGGICGRTMYGYDAGVSTSVLSLRCSWKDKNALGSGYHLKYIWVAGGPKYIDVQPIATEADGSTWQEHHSGISKHLEAWTSWRESSKEVENPTEYGGSWFPGSTNHQEPPPTIWYILLVSYRQQTHV